MKIIDLPGGQGSEAWHQHRAQHWNASDAAAMMGCSSYQTRNELLHRIWCQRKGLPVPAPSEEQQRLFDEGHRTERLARPGVAEPIIGDDLYPIVVANGRLSASLDGSTLDVVELFEHKLLNQALREAMHEGCTGADLPLEYRVQMEHQQHCAGETVKRTLFVASEWDRDGNLVEERHCWYYPEPALREKILAGWQQFERDIEAYEPREATPIVKAQPTEHLPAPSVAVSGSLAVLTNLAPFGVALRAFVEKIPKKPSTDQEFADTEAACKRLKDAEERLTAAEDAALASVSQVEQMRRAVAELREIARTTRLASEKMVKARKEQIREEEVRRGMRAMDDYINGLEFGRLIPSTIEHCGDFATVIKGLKTIDSLRNAIDTEVARAKIAVASTHNRITASMATIREAQHPALFADRNALALKDPEAVQAIVAQRLAEYKAAEEKRLEAERERIRAEEQAKITQNAQREKAGLSPGTPGACASSAAESATAAPSRDEGAAAHADTSAALPERPTVLAGTIGIRLGFTLPGAFIEQRLGIVPLSERGAVLFTESQYQQIKRALVEHIGRCA